MISRTKYIGAVEIGTAKVSVLIGEVTNGRSLSIVGMGECASRGVIKGSVFDFKAASDAAHSALLEAERSAGVRVIMITGDYPQTALAIARAAGIASERAVTGDELAAMLTLRVCGASAHAHAHAHAQVESWWRARLCP